MRHRSLRAVALATGAALALGGCQTLFGWPKPPPPPPVAHTPSQPAPKPPPPPPPPLPTPAKSCVPKSLGPQPRYPDTDAALRAAPGAADRYQMMAAGRILRQERLDELERVVAGCR